MFYICGAVILLRVLDDTGSKEGISTSHDSISAILVSGLVVIAVSALTAVILVSEGVIVVSNSVVIVVFGLALAN